MKEPKSLAYLSQKWMSQVSLAYLSQKRMSQVIFYKRFTKDKRTMEEREKAHMASIAKSSKY